MTHRTHPRPLRVQEVEWASGQPTMHVCSPVHHHSPKIPHCRGKLVTHPVPSLPLAAGWGQREEWIALSRSRCKARLLQAGNGQLYLGQWGRSHGGRREGNGHLPFTPHCSPLSFVQRELDHRVNSAALGKAGIDCGRQLDNNHYMDV